MHAAYALLPLRGLQHAPSALLVHAGKLYVGTASGTLAVYRLPPEQEGSSSGSNGGSSSDAAASSAAQGAQSAAAAALELLETHVLGSGKKSIEALGVLKECGLLIVLIDSQVCPFDLQTLSAAPPFSATRGALAFALDTSVQRLAARAHGAGGHMRGFASESGSLGRAFRPDGGASSAGTLGRAAGAGGAGAASLRGMAALIREKEDRREREREEKGARMHAENSLVSTLAVGCRRKLVIIRWLDGVLFDEKEITLPHTPRSLAFASSLCVFLGYTPTTYALQALPLALAHSPWPAARDVGAGGSEAPASGASAGGLAGWGVGALGALSRTARPPMVRAAAEGETLVLREQSSIFLSAADGSPARRDVIEWSGVPDEVAFARPYVLALLPASASAATTSGTPNPHASIAVRSAQTLSAVQTLPLPPVPGTPAGGAPLLALAGPREVIVATAEGMWQLRMRGWGEQVDELIEKQLYGEALATLEGVDEVLLPDKPARKAYVEALWALDLFRAHKYDEALEHFLELDINPAKVIALYPARIAGPLAQAPEKWASLFGAPQRLVQPQEEGKEEEETALPAAVPRARLGVGALWARRPQSIYGGGGGGATATEASAGSSAGSPSKTPRAPAPATLAPQDDDARSIASVRSSRSAQQLAKPAAPGTTTAGQGMTKAASTQQMPKAVSTTQIAPPAAAASTEASDAATQRQALDALGRFLADRRRIFKPLLEAHPASHAEHSQLPRDPAELLALPNAPLASLPLQQLTAVGQVVDTALFKTFLETKPALLGPLCRVENWCEVTQVEELLLERKKFSELIALYGGKNMHAKALALLRRFAEDEDDEEEKVGPTIRYLQNLGPEDIDLILETSHWVLEANAQLGMDIFCADVGKVSSLPRFAVVQDLERFDIALCVQYLEHIIALGEGDPSLHEKLALLLLKHVTSASRSIDSSDGGEMSPRALAVQRLHDFLESSTQYRAEKILSRLPANADDADLLEVRALLLGRLGQHEGALRIYVSRLQDADKAEAYCRRVWLDAAAGTSSTPRPADADVFLTLLRLYLRPSDGAALQLDAALRLIARHGVRIDAVAALALLPPLVQLRDIEAFAKKTLQQDAARRNEARVVRQIHASRALQLDERLLRLHTRRVKVTETRTCPRCMKRLGNSVIAVSPKGLVTHYSCR